jgi:hypothetical protein
MVEISQKILAFSEYMNFEICQSMHDFVQMGHTMHVIHARFAKKIANSSQLILSQILVEMKRNCESGDLLI